MQADFYCGRYCWRDCFARDVASPNANTHAALLTHSTAEIMAIAKDCLNSVGSPGAMANTLAPQIKANTSRAKRTFATDARPVPIKTSFDSTSANTPA